MKQQEKKYRVVSFDDIIKTLNVAGAKPDKESASDHYYARQPANDVVKLVVHGDNAAIHRLKEQAGKFDLVEKIPMANTQAGMQWLKQQGYKTADLVHMVSLDYPYRGGIVGLYTINEVLRSVILDFPEGQHEEIEAELGLQTAERIKIPYNKYLEELGTIQTIEIS